MLVERKARGGQKRRREDQQEEVASETNKSHANGQH